MKTNLSTFPENIRSLASWQIDVLNWRIAFETELRKENNDDEESFRCSKSPEDKKFYLGKVTVRQEILGEE